MNVMHKTALSPVVKAYLGRKRLGVGKKMFKAALNHDVLADIIFPKK
jgi:hypothetical protein